MTLKYESEILFDLMKRDGDDTPSDVLPYESELKEKYLKQVEGAYPKLMDYRPEWLNYNLEAHLPADFPVETLSDVTSATVDNVVPYAYRSAILKGQSKLLDELANECELPNSPKVTMGGYIDPNNGEMVASEVSFYTTFLKCPSVSFVIKGDNKFKRIIFYDENKRFLNGINNMVNTNTPIEIPYSSIPSTAVYIRISASTSASESYTPNTILLIEDTNGNNLYTTHLESVRMPVLTTTGKNLFDINVYPFVERVAYQEGNRVAWSGYCGITGYFPVKSNTTYAFSNNLNKPIYYGIVFYDNNKTKVSFGQAERKTFTTPDNCAFIRFSIQSDVTPSWVQIEESAQQTSYEPYKSNILTVNEEVELRGINDVKDELNCLTGEVTERIGEIVLDGVSIIPTANSMSKQNNTIAFDFKKSFSSLNSSIIHSLNDTFPDYSGNYLYENDVEGLSRGWNSISVRINKDRLAQADVNGFKQWLQSNPITVQYQLATEVIKTVDLNIQDQDGNTLRIIQPIEGTMHIHSDGTPVKPTITMEIPVEAITQNLASFIKEE